MSFYLLGGDSISAKAIRRKIGQPVIAIANIESNNIFDDDIILIDNHSKSNATSASLLKEAKKIAGNNALLAYNPNVLRELSTHALKKINKFSKKH